MTTAEVIAAEEVEDSVLIWLSSQNATMLQEVYGMIPLDCPSALHGKKRILLKTLLDHFCNLESDPDGDGGHSTMLSIQDFINKKNSEIVKEEIPVNMSGVHAESERQKVDPSLLQIGINGGEIHI